MENKKYDLEKAKEDCQRHKDALEEAQSCMCGHCHECGFDPAEMKAALDEIDQQAKQIEALKEKLVESEARRMYPFTVPMWDNLPDEDFTVEQVFRRKNEEITGLRARIKELEAEKERIGSAFLKAESQRLWDLGKSTGETSYDCQEAREALERIKAETGSGDHVAGANKLILTAEQREEEGKRDA